jgi:hypothetical protein
MIYIFLARKLKEKEKTKQKEKKNYSRRKNVPMASFLRRSRTPFGGETCVKKLASEEVTSLSKKLAH